MNAFDSVIATIAARSEKSKTEYLDEDGVYRCTVCNAKTRCKAKFADREVEVNCACDCDKKLEQERKDRERKELIETKKKVCFPQKRMREWTFDSDDRANPKLSDAMLRYANRFGEFLRDSKGLLLYGSVGTGKSYYAACIANKIIENGYTAHMTNFSTLVNSINDAREDRNEFIASLNRYDLLIIDDLGAERTSDYMREIVFNIIDKRCTSGLPMIITTNLSGEDFKNPDDIRMERIYDRILEMCFPIEMSGHSRRRAEAKQSYAGVKEMLGL